MISNYQLDRASVSESLIKANGNDD